MSKLARFCIRHRRLVLVFWVVLLVGVGALGKAFPAVYSNTIKLPGSQSQKAADLLTASFPAQC